jgi:hypothetical protein
MMQELLSSEQQHSETSVLGLLPNPTGFKIQLSHITTQLHTLFLHSSTLRFNGIWQGIPFFKAPKPKHLLTQAGSKRKTFSPTTQ